MACKANLRRGDPASISNEFERQTFWQVLLYSFLETSRFEDRRKQQSLCAESFFRVEQSKQ